MVGTRSFTTEAVGSTASVPALADKDALWFSRPEMQESWITVNVLKNEGAGSVANSDLPRGGTYAVAGLTDIETRSPERASSAIRHRFIR
jgi:hypothetical protein